MPRDENPDRQVTAVPEAPARHAAVLGMLVCMLAVAAVHRIAPAINPRLNVSTGEITQNKYQPREPLCSTSQTPEP
ncbi:hypothetical protein [Burkholderia gladioli]|uniref:hypothetical protein n=1 Tax=Burkholderia gladioli TaxID=28095 RepID=UPI00164115AE|nr:hypothetical protein [Burkholderia gladioli]